MGVKKDKEKPIYVSRNKKRGKRNKMIHINYSEEIKIAMKKFYETLTEKDRRRYGAIEAIKIGHGGQKYICEILNCDPDTIKKGTEELEGEIKNDERVRVIGGGRKKVTETTDSIDEVFLGILREHTGGEPMDESVKYTNLKRTEISKKFKERGMDVSEHVVKQLLEKHGFGERKMAKTKTMKEDKDRNEQFENIAKRVTNVNVVHMQFTPIKNTCGI